MSSVHAIVLPGGGYQVHAPHEAEPVAAWLESLGLSASVFRYPLNTRHPGPLDAVRAEIAARRGDGASRVVAVGFCRRTSRRHASLAGEPGDPGRPDFALLGYAITSMETDTYKRAQDVLLGPDCLSQPAPPHIARPACISRRPAFLHLAYRRRHLRSARALLSAGSLPGRPRRGPHAARLRTWTAQPRTRHRRR